MMAICIQEYSPAPYPQKMHQTMAHNSSQESFMNRKTQGEGNYASTVFSDTRDQEINQGLTLSPKIQSNDPWLFGAAGTFDDHDLDALLGPVEFDLIAEEARNEDSGVDVLFNDPYRLDEPPAKRRRLTRELPEATSQRTVSALPYLRNSTKVFQNSVSPYQSTQVLKSLSPVVLESQQTHTISLDDANPPDSLLPITPSGHCNGSIYVAEQQLGDFQDGQQLTVDSRDEGPQQLTLGCSDDDGGWFGHDVSITEPPLNWSPTAGQSSGEVGRNLELEAELEAALEAELETELEANLEAELEAELRSTTGLTIPALLSDAGLRASYSSNAVTASLDTVSHSSPPAMLRDPDAPIASVELDVELPMGRNIPEPKQSVDTRKQTHKARRSTKTATRHPSREALEARLLELENKLAQVSSSGSVNTPSTARYDRTQLPLHIALSIASPDTFQSISRVIQSATLHSEKHPLSIIHQIPDDLKKLFESLQRKFNSDPKFQESTILWIFWKMISTGSGEASEIQGFFRGVKEMSREELEQAFFEEKRNHVITKAQLEQALNKK
jgi:hypothetical protein